MAVGAQVSLVDVRPVGDGLHTDSICSISFGTNPTATTSTARMAAGQTEYHGVPVGLSYMVAAVSNT
jgi:hypothetical protein